MDFKFSRETIKDGLCFLCEEQAFSGVNKIAGKVRGDIELVFGALPGAAGEIAELGRLAVICGTAGRSSVLDGMARSGKIDLKEISGRREVYLFQLVDSPFSNPGDGTEGRDGCAVQKALVIAGSDKRGTIYGLFRLSELLGVSPLKDWCDVKPARLKEYVFEDGYKYISKEPSVRYRGFFINDEWPAFGNWCTKNFGGFNAEAYEHVFELLLRLKGNYLWPAMWSARFMDDGPGLKNAELADEYGVVMGMSHHEPCLRQGEEYKYLRGRDSVYGDAWNFRKNREGITRFWEDGLKRSGRFENVITVGMRGEADTAIMGKDATLGDNIELLRDVLQTQNRLIRENVNEDLSAVPRMLALYKEVEAFFYGDGEYEGLMGCEELDGVTLMLCDDNFGNLRTLPDGEMLPHKGGYGMYYHFDYHGWPVSFEWINSTHLPKVWEQMTEAYEFGIRDLWIVNVGDICTQEFPLSFFLDLAYDYDRWGRGIERAAAGKSGADALSPDGGKAVRIAADYTEGWVRRQFGHVFDEAELKQVCEILSGYTKLAARRRPEALNAAVYHAVNYNETRATLAEAERLICMADRLYSRVAGGADSEDIPSFFSLVYYPAVGILNLYRLQLLTTLNNYFAGFGALEANRLIPEIKGCMARDRELVSQYHEIDGGKWYGMGLSEHIGFTRWNEDECQNPVIMEVFPAGKPRVRLMADGTEQHSEGSSWLNNRLTVYDFLEPDADAASFTLYGISSLKSEYTVKCDVPWLSCSKYAGSLDGDNTAEQIVIKLDRDMLPVRADNDAAPHDGADSQGGGGTQTAGGGSEAGEAGGLFDIVTANITVELPAGKCTLEIPAARLRQSGLPEKTFICTRDYICMEAEHFYRRIQGGPGRPNSSGAADGGAKPDCACGTTESAGSEFKIIEDYGKTLSAVKAFPVNAYFTPGVDAPALEYRFVLREKGEYEAELYMQPSNACTVENILSYGIQINGGEICEYNVIPSEEHVGDHNITWAEGVLNNIRRHTCKISCKEGLNSLIIYAATPGFVLERLVISPEGRKPAESCLGPRETYYIGREA